MYCYKRQLIFYFYVVFFLILLNMQAYVIFNVTFLISVILIKQ